MDILDLIYAHNLQQKREQAHTAVVSDHVFVSDHKQIIQILTLLTHENQNPIIVKTEQHSFDYYSFLKLHNAYSPENASLFLILDALDPPIGNIRIKVSSYVILRVFTDQYCFEMSVNMIGTINGKFKLSLPKKIGIQKERRAALRIKIDPKWHLETQGRRLAGIDIPIEIDNISLGGICFTCAQYIPKIMEGLHLEIHLVWPEKEVDLTLEVVVIDIIQLPGIVKYRYHTRYRFENYDRTVRSLEEMVTDMQRYMLEHHQSNYVNW